MAGARLGVCKVMTGKIEHDVPLELAKYFGTANVDVYIKVIPVCGLPIWNLINRTRRKVN